MLYNANVLELAFPPTLCKMLVYAASIPEGRFSPMTYLLLRLIELEERTPQAKAVCC